MSGYKKWVIGVGLLVGILLQVTIIPALSFWGAGPQFLFLFALYFGYRSGPRYGFGLGLAAGYLQDIFSMGVIGAHAFSFSICGFILAWISTRVYQGWFLTKFITIFLVSLMSSLLYYLFTGLFVNLPGYFSNFKEFSLKPSLLTALIAPPIFFLLDNIFKYAPKFYYKSTVSSPVKYIPRFRE